MTPELREVEQQRLIDAYLSELWCPARVLYGPQPRPLLQPETWPTADVLMLKRIVDERDYHTWGQTPHSRGGISRMPRATYAATRDRAARESAA